MVGSNSREIGKLRFPPLRVQLAKASAYAATESIPVRHSAHRNAPDFIAAAR
jgi:hypothetical protein